MRAELARIDALQRRLRSYGMDEWNAVNFRIFWAYEATLRSAS